MLTFTVSRGQIPVAIVRNNYLNNWAFKEKIDCLKAVFCGESIRGNHFSWLLDIVFLLISTRKDAWFFGVFLLLCHWPLWWTMLRGEKSSDEQFRFNLRFTVAIHIHFSGENVLFPTQGNNTLMQYYCIFYLFIFWVNHDILAHACCTVSMCSFFFLTST